MANKNWTREELLVAIKVYCALAFGQFHSKHPKIIEVSQALGRTPSSLAMKLCNFASLDPTMAGKGLKGASKADKEMISALLEAPEAVILDSELAYQNLVINHSLTGHHQLSTAEFVYNSVENTEQVATVKVRTVQAFFRKMIISSYQYHCAVCRLNVPELLIASHIIPWSVNEKLRVMPTNGISMCALHDRAFDRGLISFDAKYHMLISPKLHECQPNEAKKILLLNYEHQKMKLPFRFYPDNQSLKWHRENVFQI